jgi:hypothetical protein
MTPTDFLQSLESVLQHRRVAFSRAAAIAFVESCWQLIEDDPDVWFWSERFIGVGAVEAGRAPRIAVATPCTRPRMGGKCSSRSTA